MWQVPWYPRLVPGVPNWYPMPVLPSPPRMHATAQGSEHFGPTRVPFFKGVQADANPPTHGIAPNSVRAPLLGNARQSPTNYRTTAYAAVLTALQATSTWATAYQPWAATT